METGPFQDPQKVSASDAFSSFLAPLGRFGAPLGPNLAPNGGPRVPKWVPKSFKINAKIDAKIDAEKVTKNMLKIINT